MLENLPEFNSISLKGNLSVNQKAQLNLNFTLGIRELLLYIKNHSIGDYLVILEGPDAIAYIASSGFSGGYIFKGPKDIRFFKNLSDLTLKIPYKDFDTEFILNSISGNIPISLLPPSPNVILIDSFDFIIKINNTIESFNLQVEMYGEESAQVREIDTSIILEKYIEELCRKDNVTVMLSGGVDSTLIGLAASECGYNPRFVNVKRSATTDNSPGKARLIAKTLGWNLECATDADFYGRASQDHLQNVMTSNLIDAMNPHWDVDAGDGIILSGQNADAIIGLDMHKFSEISEKSFKQNMKNIIKNAMFVDTDFMQVAFRLLYTLLPFKSYATLADRYMHSYVSHSKVISTANGEKHIKDCLFARSGRINNDRALLEMVNHYFYRIIALGRISKVRNRFGSLTLLPYHSAPFINLCAARHRGFREIINPKWRELELLSKHLGKDYYDIIKQSQRISVSENYELRNFSLEGILEELKYSDFADNIIEKFELNRFGAHYISTTVKNICLKNHNLTRKDLEKAFKLLNLMLLNKPKK